MLLFDHQYPHHGLCGLLGISAYRSACPVADIGFMTHQLSKELLPLSKVQSRRRILSRHAITGDEVLKLQGVHANLLLEYAVLLLEEAVGAEHLCQHQLLLGFCSLWPLEQPLAPDWSALALLCLHATTLELYQQVLQKPSEPNKNALVFC